MLIYIPADNIGVAAEKIISFVEDTEKANVIYFHGWLGLGSSTVLKEVAKRLKSSLVELHRRLDRIIHVDCSQWESKRALQKAIAEELELPQWVMSIFDQHDDEDDFNGVEQGARTVIPQVTMEILSNLWNHRFLVVFHNGSDNYIDLQECGVPVKGLMSKRVLWTSNGRFRFQGIEDEDMENFAGLSDVVMFARPLTYDMICDLIHEEAGEVARYTSSIVETGMNPKIVEECILYKALRRNDHGIDWVTHAHNYWVCDGIIQTASEGDKLAWEIGEALHRNMHLDWEKMWEHWIHDKLSGKLLQWRPTDRWVSAAVCQDLKQQKQDDDDDDALAQQLSPHATSFFCTSAGLSTDNNAIRELKANMFDHSSDKLRVIHLSQCTFSFASPPFLCCSSLRFLLLDHCKDKCIEELDHGGIGMEEHQTNGREDNGACFRKLWVLVVSYTDWYWLLSEEILGLMVDLRELHVKGVKNWSIRNLRHASGTKSSNHRLLNLVKLRVITDPMDIGANIDQESPVVAAFPNLSSSTMLKTVILDGCVELEQIGPEVLPPQLEAFSFCSDGVATKIKSISFRGCAQLKSMLLRGLFGSLKEMDMSGTSVKTLDLSAIEARCLSRLFLLGCENLRAILWPEERETLARCMLHIDTTTRAISVGEDKSSKEYGNEDTSVPSWSVSTLHESGANTTIFLRDARLLRSFKPIRMSEAYMEISSIANTVAAGFCANHGGKSSAKPQVSSISLQQPACKLYMDNTVDAFLDDHLQADGADKLGVSEIPGVMWVCPIPRMNASYYINIQDEMQTTLLQGRSEETSTMITLPKFMSKAASFLHVHDSLYITSISGPKPAVGLKWQNLLWCRIERCPNLEGVIFTPPFLADNYYDEISIFDSLLTFWASQLPKARYIWDWRSTSSFQPEYDSFEYLEFLHMDYCPRLINVLPLYKSNAVCAWSSLETLEIVCCGDLREVFPLDADIEHESIEFPKLRRIHLHELSSLQHICRRRMLAPKLETVKIRGCWGLRRLPAVRRGGTPPKVDCEKDWWDGLEWDGLEANHHPSLYETTHSLYYKKTLPRVSVLR